MTGYQHLSRTITRGGSNTINAAIKPEQVRSIARSTR